MTPEKRAESRRICDAATPGDWEYRFGLMAVAVNCDRDGCREILRAPAYSGGKRQKQVVADLEFAAHARTALPAALAALAAAEKRVTELEAEVALLRGIVYPAWHPVQEQPDVQVSEKLWASDGEEVWTIWNSPISQDAVRVKWWAYYHYPQPPLPNTHDAPEAGKGRK